MMLLLHPVFKMGCGYLALYLWLILGNFYLASSSEALLEDGVIIVEETVKKVSSKEVIGAHSEPGVVSIAEPNIGALLGIGGLTGNQALLSGINARSLAGAGLSLPPHLGSYPNAPPDIRSICNNGNADALTNLLVYQYLSGSIPNGAVGIPQLPPPGSASNPHFQALFEGSLRDPAIQTSTTVTTGLTTRTLNLDPQTQYSTSTSVYVTTITAISSSVVPIIFRGSRITTTITERKTEVLTATEFSTETSVLQTSIVQTLPLEITLLHKSTLGLNGRYTLDHIAPGATKVIEKPINTKSIDLKAHGIDLSSIDFSSGDLKDLTSGDNSDMLNALSALLEQYSDKPDSSRNSDRNGNSNRYQLNRRQNTRPSRFHGAQRPPPFEDKSEEPKISVIKGFTLRDRERPRSRESSSPSGTAAFNTRYSKFLKKDKVKNNSLQPQDTDRESEPFSASTSRRTVSSARERRRHVPPGSFHRGRIPATGRSISSSFSTSSSNRDTSIRRNRHIEDKAIRRRAGRTFRNRNSIKNTISRAEEKKSIKTTTAVLTLRIHGSTRGLARTILRTITLGTYSPTARLRRHITISASKPIEKLIETTTESPPKPNNLSPEDVVVLLKKVDKKNVQLMLHSLKNWVEFYTNKVLGEVETSGASYQQSRGDIATNEIPELTSSLLKESVTSADLTMQTAELPLLPQEITQKPSIIISSNQGLCSPPKTLTTTVYKTLYLSQP